MPRAIIQLVILVTALLLGVIAQGDSDSENEATSPAEKRARVDFGAFTALRARARARAYSAGLASRNTLRSNALHRRAGTGTGFIGGSQATTRGGNSTAAPAAGAQTFGDARLHWTA